MFRNVDASFTCRKTKKHLRTSQQNQLTFTLCSLISCDLNDWWSVWWKLFCCLCQLAWRCADCKNHTSKKYNNPLLTDFVSSIFNKNNIFFLVTFWGGGIVKFQQTCSWLRHIKGHNWEDTGVYWICLDFCYYSAPGSLGRALHESEQVLLPPSTLSQRKSPQTFTECSRVVIFKVCLFLSLKLGLGGCFRTIWARN